MIFWRKVRHHSFTGVVLDTDASQPELATNFREGHINLTPQAFPVVELTKTDILRVYCFWRSLLLFITKTRFLTVSNPVSITIWSGHSWVI